MVKLSSCRLVATAEVCIEGLVVAERTHALNRSGKRCRAVSPYPEKNTRKGAGRPLLFSIDSLDEVVAPTAHRLRAVLGRQVDHARRVLEEKEDIQICS